MAGFRSSIICFHLLPAGIFNDAAVHKRILEQISHHQENTGYTQMKKTILHFIYDLGRGGAETMLVRVVKELSEYNNIVVTLYDTNHFKGELVCDKYICLHQGSLLNFPISAWKLAKIIRENKVDIVHTHLFWPTFIARIATPKKITLITTIHSFIATSVEYKHWYIRLLDKTSYLLRRSVIIGVAKGATKEYFSFLKIKPFKAYHLYTFVDIEKFKSQDLPSTKGDGTFKILSTGALRLQKNHSFLINAFRQLKNEPVELHIYGIGPLHQQLQSAINESGAKVILKGQVKDVQSILPSYDLFVMSSTFEGFSLSVLEAMAMKVPLLLSDISSFREQCAGTASYFSLEKTEQFIHCVREIKSDEPLRNKMKEEAFERVVKNFTLPHHMKKLREIYIESLSNE
jgi:glycosyltransferase involved in cell wall biosynthesis